MQVTRTLRQTDSSMYVVVEMELTADTHYTRPGLVYINGSIDCQTYYDYCEDDGIHIKGDHLSEVGLNHMAKVCDEFMFGKSSNLIWSAVQEMMKEVRDTVCV
jgi:hypothetical protein